MRHDFDPSPGSDRICTTDGSVCTNDGGVMDYFQVSLFLKNLLPALKPGFLKKYSVSAAKRNTTEKFQKITKNIYISNRIRKTKKEHLKIVRQNLNSQ